MDAFMIFKYTRNSTGMEIAHTKALEENIYILYSVHNNMIPFMLRIYGMFST